MKPGGDFHGHARRPRLLVPKHVLDHPAALDPGDGVLHPNPNPRQLPVGSLLGSRQLTPGRPFFFAWQVFATGGSYPWNPASLYRVVPGGYRSRASSAIRFSWALPAYVRLRNSTRRSAARTTSTFLSVWAFFLPL